MQYRNLGSSGAKVSELGLGTMTFGRECDERASHAILDRFLEAGGNLVDTANNYGGTNGSSEEIIGRALHSRRDDVVVATKVRFLTAPGVNDRGLSRRHIRMSVDASLRRLQTDWIDLLQLHSWDPTTSIEETLATLDDLVTAGKVAYVGVSNFTGWQVALAASRCQSNGWTPLATYQGNYSLVGRDLEREVMPFCQYGGMGVLCYGPLGGGLLTGKYERGVQPEPGTRAGGGDLSAEGMSRRMTDRAFHVAETVKRIAGDVGRTPAQVAVNWASHRPAVTAALIGARTVEQLTDTLGGTGWTLDSASADELDAASAIHFGYPQEFQSWMASIAM